MKKIYEDLLYSFPVQLSLLHLKRNHVMLFFWIILFATVLGSFGAGFGIPYLYLDPEYLGSVNWLSFAVVGMAFGGFIVTWQLTSYLLNSYRFPFLASLRFPFAMYVLNNAMLPVIFVVVYIVSLVRFQTAYEYKSNFEIFIYVCGFLGGVFLMQLIALLYFQGTNRNVYSFLGKKKHKEKDLKPRESSSDMREEERWEAQRGIPRRWRVETYISSSLRVRLTREVQHYDNLLRRSVFRQHHYNALLVQIGAVLLIVALGYLMERGFFQLPAAASATLLLTVLMSISAVFRYWTGGWSTSIFIVLFLFINFLTRYELFTFENKAYGLDYDTKAEYSYENLNALCSTENVLDDKLYTLDVLENWKAKASEGQPAGYKPKMIMIAANGGGFRSSLFTMRVLQQADSLSSGQLMNNTMLMSGASGGAYGTTYARELYLQTQNGELSSWYGKEYAYSIANDLLNAIMVSVVTNDLFYPWQQFEIGDNKYHKDRGYMMELQLNRNTDFAMDKTIADYREAEYNAEIPMLIMSNTVINDGRLFHISPQPISYLMKPPAKTSKSFAQEVDAIDWGAFFAGQDGYNVRMTTAIRMNSTYPYILPNVSLPTEPRIEVLDAGARDNMGMEVPTRFMLVFSEWIKENTSGVILVEIRSSHKFEKIEGLERQSLLSKMFSPFGVIYGNITTIQDYAHDQMLSEANEALAGKLEVVRFMYSPDEEKEEGAAMSMHLTTREKKNVLMHVHNSENNRSFDQLLRSLNLNSPWATEEQVP